MQLVKIEDVVDIFRKVKFELFSLTETKIKWNREISVCGLNYICGEVEKSEKAREGVAPLLNDVWYFVVLVLLCQF